MDFRGSYRQDEVSAVDLGLASPPVYVVRRPAVVDHVEMLSSVHSSASVVQSRAADDDDERSTSEYSRDEDHDSKCFGILS